jgi:hypothetical protein
MEPMATSETRSGGSIDPQRVENLVARAREAILAEHGRAIESLLMAADGEGWFDEGLAALNAADLPDPPEPPPSTFGRLPPLPRPPR